MLINFDGGVESSHGMYVGTTRAKLRRSRMYDGKLPVRYTHHDNMSVVSPLTPHFYLVKMGFTRYTFFFLCLL